jgi:hypothetical protein
MANLSTVVSFDGTDGTVFQLTDTGFVTCFCPGTHILTDRGEIAVETLAIGDTVITASGDPAPVRWISYYHVELDRHALLLAEGAPAESFLDADCRSQFHNATEFTALYPDAPPMTPLQPRLEDWFALQMIQERLATRAGVTAPVEPAGRLHGVVDLATPRPDRRLGDRRRQPGPAGRA